MKIAIVYPLLTATGGAENVIIWLAESLVSRGHTVDILTKEFCEKVWGSAKEKPYNVKLLDFKKYRSTLKTNIDAGRSLGIILKETQYDVINPHSYPASLWVYYSKAEIGYHCPTVVYLHHLSRNFYGKIVNVNYGKLKGFRNIWDRRQPEKLFRKARQLLFNYRKLDQAAIVSSDLILANSSYAAGLATKIYNVEVKACPLGIDVNKFSNSSPQKVNNSPPYVLTVARIETQKNFQTILQAISVLKAKAGPVSTPLFMIAGGGPYLEYFRKLCKKMGLENIVNFLGSVQYEKLMGLYQNCLFALHIPLDEPFGLIPLEAALFKKTCVVSDHGGPAEIVINKKTGLHVNTLDKSDVAKGIEYLLKNPEITKKMGDDAYLRVRELYNWDNFVFNFEQNLLKVLD